MNFKNLAMWGIIVILTIGLYNMFKNPQGSISQKNKIIFSEFLTEVDNGRVVKVEIQGKNIKGVLSNGNQGLLVSSPESIFVDAKHRNKASKYLALQVVGLAKTKQNMLRFNELFDEINFDHCFG